jgi:hypothetical protein
MENGDNFPNAFENHMGFSVDEYEASFFELIAEFL